MNLGSGVTFVSPAPGFISNLSDVIKGQLIFSVSTLQTTFVVETPVELNLDGMNSRKLSAKMCQIVDMCFKMLLSDTRSAINNKINIAPHSQFLHHPENKRGGNYFL